MPKILYQCTICGTLHETEEAANHCEALGIPSFQWKPNQYFIDQYGMINEIVALKIVLVHNSHQGRYQIYREGSTKLLTEKTIFSRGWQVHDPVETK